VEDKWLNKSTIPANAHIPAAGMGTAALVRSITVKTVQKHIAVKMAAKNRIKSVNPGE